MAILVCKYKPKGLKMLKIPPKLFFNSITHCRNQCHCPCQESLDQALKQLLMIVKAHWKEI